MLLLLDEYGDKGLKLDGGSSVWLIVAGCLFANREIAEEATDQLASLHESLGGREFHFTKDSTSRRQRVLACIASLPFTYHIVACDKRRLRIRDWRPDDLYAEVGGQLVDLLKPQLTNCTVWFDTLGSKKADRTYGQRLSRRAGHSPAGPRISHTAALISSTSSHAQLADYVCGALSRSIRAEVDDANDYREMIRAREGTVLSWPVESEAG